MVLGFLLGVLLVVGLIVAWKPLDRAEFRRRAAMPLGLLVGALALLAITGFGRAGIASFAREEPLPPPRRRDDVARARRSPPTR